MSVPVPAPTPPPVPSLSTYASTLTRTPARKPRTRARPRKSAPALTPPPPPPPIPSAHRYVVVRGEMIDVTTLTPPQVVDMRAAEAAGEVYCPTCQGPLRLVISSSGPVAVHTPENPFREHEPEDHHSRRAKHLLKQRLQDLFPSGNVQLDAQLPSAEQLADVALVNPRGGKVVVEYQTQDLDTAQVRARAHAYESQGIRCLWLVDIRRLKLTKKGEAVKKATLNKLETALLAAGEPLIYLDAGPRQVVWLRPHPDAVELARLGEGRIGQVECLVRRYPLSGLRLRDAQWQVDTSMDETVAPPAPLPANLQKKLNNRREAAQQTALS